QLDKAKLHKLAETWPGSTKKELEPFQGLWKVTELLYNDKRAPGKLPDLEWIIIDDNLVILIEGADARMGKIRVVSPADRKGELSVTYSNENGTTFNASGTYEWQGDKLKLTMLPESRPGSPKPAAETAFLQRVRRAEEFKPDSPEI